MPAPERYCYQADIPSLPTDNPDQPGASHRVVVILKLRRQRLRPPLRGQLRDQARRWLLAAEPGANHASWWPGRRRLREERL